MRRYTIKVGQRTIAPRILRTREYDRSVPALSGPASGIGRVRPKQLRFRPWADGAPG
jgi:hypothetical protein